MARDNHSPAQREAVARYQAKTYKKINISLRVDEDAGIIESLDAAQAKGISYREWIRELLENQK